MELDLGLLFFSFSAGVAAFFNPCGFALLPSYVSYALSQRQKDEDEEALRRARVQVLRRALQGLALGAAVSAGFMTVFAALGIVFSWVGSALAHLMPWIASLVGVGLIVLGVFLLLGQSPTLPFHPEAWLRLNRPPPREGRGRGGHSDGTGLGFYYTYGIGYALASVSCTLPIFMVVVAQAFAVGPLNGTVHFLAYGLGMALMMLTLSFLVALSKAFVDRALRPLTRYIPTVGALVLIAAGGYLIYYNLIYSGLLGR